jgi:hypothetical protein
MRSRKRDFASLNLHLELFTVPSSLTTLYEFGKRGALKDSPGFEYGMVGDKAQAGCVRFT